MEPFGGLCPEKAKCVSWYPPNGSITLAQGNFCNMYTKTPLAQNSIINTVQNFVEQEQVGNAQAPERFTASSDQVQMVSNYFIPYMRRSLRRVDQYLRNLRSFFPDMIRNRLDMFAYEIQIGQHFKNRHYEARIQFPNCCLHNI